MTSRIVHRTARSVGDALEATRQIALAFKGTYDLPEEVWFRGQSARRYELVPKLYRADVAALNFDEESLHNRFRTLAAPMLGRPVESEWDWYYLARHHGLPGRLLDWTESLIHGLYFALEGHWPRSRVVHEQVVLGGRGPEEYTADSPVVWLLDAGSLNRMSAGDDYVYFPGGAHTAKYLPGALNSSDVSSRLPIAILPSRSNPRIVAQQGMFTVHGHERGGIELLADAEDGIRLGCITLDTGSIHHLIDELGTLGMTRYAVYPDLDAVATQVAWMYESRDPL